MSLNNSIYVDTDIIVRLEDTNRDSLSSIQKIMIPTSNGIVPISSVVNIHKDTGPTEINRKNDKRIIQINASSYGIPINEIVNDIRKELNNIYIYQAVFQLIFPEIMRICRRLSYSLLYL